MTDDQLNDVVSHQIAFFEKERSDSLSKAQEYHNKATALETRATELDAVIRNLKDYQNKINGVTTKAASPHTPNKKPKVDIRSLARSYIQTHHEFTSDELFGYIRASLPDAHEGTIRAEISRSKRLGRVVSISRNKYRSLECQTQEQATTEEPVPGSSESPESDMSFLLRRRILPKEPEAVNNDPEPAKEEGQKEEGQPESFPLSDRFPSNDDLEDLDQTDPFADE